MSGELAARPIAWVGAAIAATVLLVVGAVFLLLHLWQARFDANRVDLPYRVEVPGPVLQSAPQLDLAQYRAEKQRIVESAAWVDAQRGIARIPVADAMALLAASAARRPASQPQARPQPNPGPTAVAPAPRGAGSAASPSRARGLP